MDLKTYAVIAADGDDAVYMFSGECDILLKLIPGLEEQINKKCTVEKMH